MKMFLLNVLIFRYLEIQLMQYYTKPLLLLLTAGLLSLVSCSKPTELGLSLVELNPSEIFETDSLSLTMQTVSTDPLPTDDRSRWLCGSYLDPIFGKTTVGIYTNFRLTSTNASFPDATFDSLILSIVYDSIGHYGGDLNALEVQNWEVYRIEEEIEPNTEYNADANFALGELLGTASFTPNFYTSVDIQGEVEAPQMRIRLLDTLGKQLMNPDSAIYENNSAFKEFLKGVCIRPVAAANNSTVIRLLPNSVDTRLTLHYTDSSGTAQSFKFLTDDDSESALNIEHNYEGTTIFDNNGVDTVVYMQGINGPSVRIEIPHLDSLGDVIINRAELVIYVAGEEDRNYPIPDQLFCVEKTAEGDYSLIEDVVTSISRNSFDPFKQFGGILQSDGPIRYFSMNLSEFMQRLLDGEVDEKAIYIQPASVTDTERMLLINSNNTVLKAKLNLTYTKTN